MSIFDPQIQQGSTMAGESAIQRPVPVDLEKPLTQVGKAAAYAYGNKVIENTERQLSEEDSAFLGGIQTAREMNMAGEAPPGEEATYRSTVKRIDSIDKAVLAGSIDPFAADARRRSILQSALNKAPFFAQQIRQRFVGGSKSEAQILQESMMKSAIEEQEEIANNGLDRFNPKHVELFRQSKIDKLNAEAIANKKVIGGQELAFSFKTATMSSLNTTFAALNKLSLIHI